LSDADSSTSIAVDRTPPCKRCGSRDWSVEPRQKGRLRWALETIFAALDVWIFQSESAGWPEKTFEMWTCRKCGHRARVS
jgi:ribosomal protein L37E